MGFDTCYPRITTSKRGAGIEVLGGVREPAPPRKPSGILCPLRMPNSPSPEGRDCRA
ncbi:MAG: hypothetical protein METHAR1v1_310003 [Methanothrix sp.]|nr:MAG: hypothetical protein METHAR1v1_310003 [Methanothrix sp.]